MFFVSCEKDFCVISLTPFGVRLDCNEDCVAIGGRGHSGYGDVERTTLRQSKISIGYSSISDSASDEQQKDEISIRTFEPMQRSAVLLRVTDIHAKQR